MFAQFRIAWPLNWNAVFQSRGDTNTDVDLSVTEVLPQFAIAATHSRSGESLFALLRLQLLGLDVSGWLGTPLATTTARRDQAPYRVLRCQRRARSDIFAFGIALAVAVTATAAPAAASYRFGYWGPHYWAPHKRAAHSPKTAERVSKEPVADLPKGPLQIFISINQQKMHVYGNGVHIADTSIATGVPGLPTPLGVFSVIQKQVFHRSNIYSNAPMPYMQRITWSGVAMHEGESIGHRASHGCIRMPRDFAIRLYRQTRLGTRVIIANSELKPAEFADPHLFVHKEKPPEIAAAPPNSVETAAAKPAELAAHADTPALLQPVQSDVLTPQVTAPAVSADPKIESPKAESPKAESAAHPADLGKAGDATAPTPPSPADLAKVAAAKKTQIAIFISRKRQRLYVRQNFEPLFDAPVAIAQPEAPIGTHVFTALEFTGPDRTALRWNVVSLPGEAPKRVQYVEERGRYGEPGRRRRREVVDERAADAPSPQNPAQVLGRIDIPTDISEAISQMIVPGSSLVVSDQGLGDETGEGTDFVVVTH
jgi:lipoprotein-anchoring transpeptidase ErfK/SrfK